MNISKTVSITSLISILLLITACSSHIPAEISTPVAGSADIASVISAPDNYINQKVRWGGIILKTENKTDNSQLTLVGFPLDDQGEPQISDQSPGRFIAVLTDFVEPVVYTKDRILTITGKLSGSHTEKVGDFDYEYPVVQVEHYYLWPVKQEPNYDDLPYWWYDPYYPWHYPYPRRPYHLHR